MDLGDVDLVCGDGARCRSTGRARVLYVSAIGPMSASALRNDETETSVILPLDEVLKVLLDEDAKLVLDLWDVLRICRSSVWDLVVLETLIGALIVTCRPETF